MVRLSGNEGTRLHSAAEVAPGVGIFLRAVKADGPARPARLAPVHARAALLPEDLHHPLQERRNSSSLACVVAFASPFWEYLYMQMKLSRETWR